MLGVMPELGANATYQYYRTERWLGRMEAIYDGKYTPVGNSDDLLDHILAFFLNCYHIKDWLKNGPEWQVDVDGGLKRMAVEQFVTESEALCICADLCNGNKTLRTGKAAEWERPGSSECTFLCRHQHTGGDKDHQVHFQDPTGR
jgi:hypothetical protein